MIITSYNFYKCEVWMDGWIYVCTTLGFKIQFGSDLEHILQECIGILIICCVSHGVAGKSVLIKTKSDYYWYFLI